MSIASEAAYLYIRSKEFSKVNRQLQELSKKAQHHRDKHAQATDEAGRAKHKRKHSRITDDIKDLMKRHNMLLSRIKHHMVRYNDALRKEHKL